MRRSGLTSVVQIGRMKSAHESRSEDTNTRTARQMMNMYSVSTLHGAGGRMPKRSTTKARTSTTTAWKKRERSRLMPSLQRQQKGHEVHVLLGRESRAEVLRHHARRIVGDRAHALGIED